MKLSQMIGALIAIKNEHGDLDVYCTDSTTTALAAAREVQEPKVTSLKVATRNEQYRKFYWNPDDKRGELVVRIA